MGRNNDAQTCQSCVVVSDPAKVPPLRGQRSLYERRKKLAAPVGMTACGESKGLRSKRPTFRDLSRRWRVEKCGPGSVHA